VQKQTRQYAEYEDTELKFREADDFGGKRGAKCKKVNSHDQAFIDATTAWPDWGYGFTGEASYTFGLHYLD
jgi:hypothetical protein